MKLYLKIFARDADVSRVFCVKIFKTLYTICMKKILIIGGGNIGQAIKTLLLQSNNTDRDIKVFDKTQSLSDYEELAADVLQHTDHMFICVPSVALGGLMNELQDLPRDTNISILTKGFLPGTSTHPFEFFREFGFINVSLVYGPMLAREISEGKVAYATIAGGDTAHETIQLFVGSHLKTEYVADLEPVACAGILKNIYALALGAIHNHGSDNAIGGLITDMVQEAQRILEHNMLADISLQYCFLGDVIATGTSEHSSNHTVGKKLAGGEVCDLNSEGCRSIDAFVTRYCEGVDTPLVDAIAALVSGGSYTDFERKVL